MAPPPAPPPPAENEKTPPAETDLETGGGAKVLAGFVEAPAPNTPLSFLTPAPEKLNDDDPEPGPGSVLDFPKAKRLPGLSLGLLTELLLLLKENAAAVVVGAAA